MHDRGDNWWTDLERWADRYGTWPEVLGCMGIIGVALLGLLAFVALVAWGAKL